MNNITINTQSSIKIKTETGNLYFDPYLINEESHDAMIIFITHEHYDHFSKEAIDKVKNDKTLFVIPKSIKEQFFKNIEVSKEKCILVEPNMEFKIESILIKTVPAYNLNKKFHLKEYNWCGYVITVDNICYYIAGDTDNLKENYNIICDVAFIPIGGTYTMDVEEALDYVLKIKPKTVIPIHYGSIVGEKIDGQKFKQLLEEKNKEIKVELKL